MRLLRFALYGMLVAALLPVGSLVRAQEPDTVVEQTALRAHLQNQRTHSYTDWIGGPLGDAENAPVSSPLGETLDDWELDGLAGDDGLAFDDLERPTLLNFWASWCYPCRLEFPHLSDVALNADQHSFDVVFVNVWDTSQASAESFLTLYSPDLRTVIDSEDRLASRAGIESIPTSLLIDTDGSVLAVHVGLITPTLVDFLDAASDNPDEGSFAAAEYADLTPQADLQPVELDDAFPITFGEPVTGTITENDTQDAYQFEGREGDMITISLSAPGTSELDCYVALLAADGTRVAENDDINPGIIQDSLMTVTLPADGTYIVVATRFLEGEGFSVGRYKLVVEREGEVVTGDAQQPPVTGEVERGSQIAYGDTVAGSITDAHYEQHWMFVGARGDVITAAMHRADSADSDPGGLDGYMQLAGPSGDILLEVDDSAESVMPNIDAYTLPADGTYTLIATRFAFANGLSTGDYTLTLQRRSAPSVAAPDTATPGSGARWLPDGVLPANLRQITYNVPVTGSLDSGVFDAWYIFRGLAGDTLTITMTAASDELDPLLLLTDEYGFELARSDDATSATRDAAITDFTLPADGSYLVRATRYGVEYGPSQGDYTLLIDTDAPSLSALEAVRATDLALGDVVTGSLDLNHSRALYTFTASAGDWVTIGVQRTSGDLEPALTVYDPEGKAIALHPERLFSGEARISRLEVPADGTYQIEVRLESLATSGDYRLIVLPAAPVEIDSGAFVPADGLDVEIVLIWASEVDLDLSVPADPAITGEQIVHANDFCASTIPTPVERFTKEAGSSWRGLYTIHITYRLNCTGQSEPLEFILVIAQNSEVVDIIGGTLTREGDTYTTYFPVAP